MALVAAELKQF